MSTIMNVENLSYEIGGKKIIDDISFSLKENSINAVLTSNNSCKTTLIKTLSGILDNDGGKITVNNIVLNKSNFKKYLLNISTILDDIDDSFLFDTVSEEIEYPLINLKYSRLNIDSSVDYVSKLLDIEDLINKKVKNLNYFEKVKVLLAVSIINSPKVLLVDDIMRFLNQNQKIEIIKLFNIICDELDITILYTTSYLNDVIGLNNIFVLNEGKIIMNDSFNNIILKDNELSKIGIEIPLMIDLSRKLQFYKLINKIYYDPDKVVEELWK